MHSTKSLLAIWLALALNLLVDADAPVRSQQMSAYFDIHAESCRGKKLDKLLQGTYKLADAGTKAFADLEQFSPSPEAWKARPQGAERTATLNIIQAAHHAWGTIDADTALKQTNGWPLIHSSIIGMPAANLDQIHEWFAYIPPPAEAKPFLACGSSAYKKAYLAVLLEPSEPSVLTTLGSTEGAYLYVWYSPLPGDSAQSQTRNTLPESDEEGTAGVCEGQTYAFVIHAGSEYFPRMKQVVLCDNMFDKLMTLDNMRGLDAPDPKRTPEDNLGDFYFAEAAFLHEMLHVIDTDVTGETYVDEPMLELTSEERKDRMKTVQGWENGKKVVREAWKMKSLYGPEIIAKLSKDPDGYMTQTELYARAEYYEQELDGEQMEEFDELDAVALWNYPDAFAWFCTAVLWPDIRWQWTRVRTALQRINEAKVPVRRSMRLPM